VILQLRVTLIDIEPAIWRQVRVPDQMTLRELHSVLQVAVGWEDAHMHQFTVGDETYGEPDPMFGSVRSETRTVLGSVVGKGDAFAYVYDMGDSWEHEILVESVLDDDGGPLPLCVDGRRACPPEDCGGPWGYGELLEILKNPKHDEYPERLAWLGGGYDPEAFHLDQVNARLVQLGSGLRDKMRLRSLKQASRQKSGRRTPRAPR
jgi:hypothetical protein